ncbi:MAG: hypothetical protein GY714_02320 [Desulfobacterales bacterium]|nr:hypothetical protein [Desulfobacterales bacterium]
MFAFVQLGANEALEKEIRERDEKYAKRGENLLSQIEEEERQIKELQMELENSKRTVEELQSKTQPLETSLEDEKSLEVFSLVLPRFHGFATKNKTELRESLENQLATLKKENSEEETEPIPPPSEPENNESQVLELKSRVEELEKEIKEKDEKRRKRGDHMLSQIEEEEREIKELMDTVKAREEERDAFQQSLDESKSDDYFFFSSRGLESHTRLFSLLLCN